jgi:hypothetical protein
MTTTASDHLGEQTTSEGWAKLTLSAPVMTAVIAGCFTLLVAFVGPRLTQGWQDHSKRIDIESLLATDMSSSFTTAIGASGRIATGLIYGPTGDPKANAAVVQGEYNRGLGQWQVGSGRVAAELAARFHNGPIVDRWKAYRLNVTRLYRLSAVLVAGTRPAIVKGLRGYVKSLNADTSAPAALRPLNRVDWAGWKELQRNTGFKHNRNYRNAYDQLSTALLALGDTYVQELVALRPDV